MTKQFLFLFPPSPLSPLSPVASCSLHHPRRLVFPFSSSCVVARSSALVVRVSVFSRSNTLSNEQASLTSCARVLPVISSILSCRVCLIGCVLQCTKHKVQGVRGKVQGVVYNVQSEICEYAMRGARHNAPCPVPSHSVCRALWRCARVVYGACRVSQTDVPPAQFCSLRTRRWRPTSNVSRNARTPHHSHMLTLTLTTQRIRPAPRPCAVVQKYLSEKNYADKAIPAPSYASPLHCSTHR